MNTLAIIPARGGSKGIPRKNVAMLCGKPLIAWSIAAALQADSVNRVAVSTDHLEIGHVARQHGAEVFWRPPEISGDCATSEEALLDCLQQLEASERYRPDTIVFLQCTSPLTQAADIDGTVQTMCQQNADTAVAVVDFHYFLWQEAEGQLNGINHDKHVRSMRQQVSGNFLEAGAVYTMKTDGFLQHRHRFFGKTVGYETPRERCWEIDDPIDLKIADFMLRERERATYSSDLNHRSNEQDDVAPQNHRGRAPFARCA